MKLKGRNDRKGKEEMDRWLLITGRHRRNAYITGAHVTRNVRKEKTTLLSFCTATMHYPHKHINLLSLFLFDMMYAPFTHSFFLYIGSYIVIHLFIHFTGPLNLLFGVSR
jgi:hypothetical protein